MTRINVIPVNELCDQHLLAEFRELTRIPNQVNSGKYSLKNIPDEYCLGTGHVKFFCNKLPWLQYRYDALYKECLGRGFNVTYIFPKFSYIDQINYTPTYEAMQLNQSRIDERLPSNARYTKWELNNWLDRSELARAG